MAVVAFPTDLAPQGPEPSMSWELRTLTARNMSPLNGVATTLERAGSHWAARLPYQNLAESRRARFQTLAASLRGHANRCYAPVFGWTRRGSFPATELLPALSSTTGWVGNANAGSVPTIASVDGLMRVTMTGSASNPFFSTSPNVSVTPYAPYCMRGLALHGRGDSNIYTVFASDGSIASGTVGTPPTGMHSAVIVPGASPVGVVPVTRQLTSAGLAGDYFECGYASFARCALVDNGQNSLLRSDEFDNAAWTKANVSITANYTAAPDGTSTADRLVEDTNNTQHWTLQSLSGVTSSAVDIVFSCAIKADVRSWAFLLMYEGAGNAVEWFNLSSPAVGTGSTGSGWANRRSFVRDLGNGWVQCSLVARKTSAATTVTFYIGAATADGVSVYTGGGAGGILLWRGTVAQSSVPTRLVQTTTVATSGTSQTGSALHLKGLPASTSGLLLQGDPAEIIIGTTSQLVRTTKPLNSDAAGLGHWYFEPPLRVSPSDNAAVIVHNPLCKMMMEDNVNGWTDRAAGFSDLDLALVEDTYPS